MPQDNKKLLQDALNALDKAKRDISRRDSILDEDRKNLVTSIGKDLVNVLEPLLEEIAENSKINRDEIKRAIEESTIKVNVESEAPIVNVNVPDIEVPEAKVTVDIPPIKIPEIVMPD